MSGLTVAAPPTTVDVSNTILATMAAKSGVITDYNPGSQIRTTSESIGAVLEQQGIANQAQAYQALIYSALSLFGITPGQPTAASGAVLISTAPTLPYPNASQNVPIPVGTVVQTPSNVQFQTTVVATLVSGTGSVSIPAQALTLGSAGNVASGQVTQIVTGLIYPLFVTNPAAMSGGLDAETSAHALSRFTAEVASIGLSSPVAIANAVASVSIAGESVAYAGVCEGWIAAGSGAGSGTAGYTVILDNGAGTASSGLIAAVIAKLNGGSVSGIANPGSGIGYRDVGVPYTVVAVTPTYAVVSVTGVTNGTATDAQLSAATSGAVGNYFQLTYGTPALQAQIAAAIANAVQGQISSIAVALMVSGSGTPVSGIVPPVSGRVLLSALLQNWS